MQTSPDLQWQKGRDGWIPFDQLNLQSKSLNDVSGIYILWAGDQVIKIGKGRIRDELVKAKTNRQIVETAGLMVSWCEVPEPWKLDDVLRALIKKLNPKITDGPRFESGKDVPVNIPWQDQSLIKIRQR